MSAWRSSVPSVDCSSEAVALVYEGRGPLSPIFTESRLHAMMNPALQRAIPPLSAEVVMILQALRIACSWLRSTR